MATNTFTALIRVLGLDHFKGLTGAFNQVLGGAATNNVALHLKQTKKNKMY